MGTSPMTSHASRPHSRGDHAPLSRAAVRTHGWLFSSLAKKYDFYPLRALASSPRTTAQTAWRISVSFVSVTWPATRRTMLLLAVTSLCGKRKLCFGNPPAKKSDSWIGIAFLCVRGWLVIWQNSTSRGPTPPEPERDAPFGY